MKERNIDKIILGHDARNVELLESLREKGINIDEKRSIEFHFWAWSQRDATFLGKALYDLGYLLLMLSPAEIEEDPDCWNIEASVEYSPSHAASHELSEQLTRLSAKYNCVYDGWGTRI